MQSPAAAVLTKPELVNAQFYTQTCQRPALRRHTCAYARIGRTCLHLRACTHTHARTRARTSALLGQFRTKTVILFFLFFFLQPTYGLCHQAVKVLHSAKITLKFKMLRFSKERILHANCGNSWMGTNRKCIFRAMWVDQVSALQWAVATRETAQSDLWPPLPQGIPLHTTALQWMFPLVWIILEDQQLTATLRVNSHQKHHWRKLVVWQT